MAFVLRGHLILAGICQEPVKTPCDITSRVLLVCYCTAAIKLLYRTICVLLYHNASLYSLSVYHSDSYCVPCSIRSDLS